MLPKITGAHKQTRMYICKTRSKELNHLVFEALGAIAESEYAALANCGSSCCDVQVGFANACGAVAKGDGSLGWAWNADKELAQANALASCDNGSCEIAVWACTDR